MKTSARPISACTDLTGDESVSGNVSANIDLTGGTVGDYSRATSKDTKAAIGAAKAVFPAWSRSGILEHHAILKKTDEKILARKEGLGRLLARQESKTQPEAIGEATRAGQIFDFFAGVASRFAVRAVEDRRGDHPRGNGRRRRHLNLGLPDR